MNNDDTNFFNKFEECGKEIKVGKPIEIGERTIYPLVEVNELKDPSYEFMSIIPIALVVVEGENKYMLTLDEDKISEELMELI
jgi:uncharacterized spore protein YtfJ